MKYLYTKIKMLSLLAFATVIATLTSCDFEEQVDPDGPSLSGVLSGASVNQLNNLVVGVEARMRNSLGIQTTGSGTMARELYLFDADPRNTADLLGKNGASLDNNSFYSTAPWAARYRTIKNANILIQSVNNTESVTSQQAAGYLGFAKTIQAYELIDILKSYNRARLDVADDLNLGPILEFGDALAQVRALLDEALTDLNAAGSSFEFPLAGFSDLRKPDPANPGQFLPLTPSDFTEFNRAVAAIAALYANDKSSSLSALNASYFDLNGSLSSGAKHVFSNNAGDINNPVFRVPSGATEDDANNGDQIIVHNSWINDAESGDNRVASKAAVRILPTSQDDLNGTHETRLYASNVSSIDIIRNEELVLIYAEANIGSNNSEAVNALNIIRNSAGLSNYGGATDDASLVTELLKQRRYSLWSENHRMFDLRRYNLSNSLPIDRSGDQVFNILPVPLTENE